GRVLFLHQVEDVQHHQILAPGVDIVLLHVRFFVGLRVITVDTDFHCGSPLSVGAHFRLESVDGLRLEVDVALAQLLAVRVEDRVTQPVLVVTIREVVTAVGTTAFGAAFGGNGSGFRHLQRVVQLERFDARGVERLALVFQMTLGDTLAQLGNLLHAVDHQVALAEDTEGILHGALQAVAQLGHRFAIAGFFPATHARQRTVEVVAARLGLLHTLAQRVLDIQAGGATEYHQVEQRVTAEAVGTVYRYARHFTHGEQAINDFRVAFMTAAQAQRLAVNVGRDTTHHVMTGRHYRNRLLDRVGMTEGLGQLTD